MTLKVFAILDTKSNTFSNPFFMKATGEAIRAFSDLANDPQSTVYRHPDDFRLFYIADFDQESAAFDAPAKPTPLASAAEFKRPTPQLSLIPEEKAS